MHIDQRNESKTERKRESTEREKGCQSKTWAANKEAVDKRATGRQDSFFFKSNYHK